MRSFFNAKNHIDGLKPILRSNYIKEIMDYGTKQGHNTVYPCLVNKIKTNNNEIGLEITHYDFPLVLLSELGLVKFNFE